MPGLTTAVHKLPPHVFPRPSALAASHRVFDGRSRFASWVTKPSMRLKEGVFLAKSECTSICKVRKLSSRTSWLSLCSNGRASRSMLFVFSRGHLAAGDEALELLIRSNISAEEPVSAVAVCGSNNDSANVAINDKRRIFSYGVRSHRVNGRQFFELFLCLTHPDL